MFCSMWKELLEHEEKPNQNKTLRLEYLYMRGLHQDTLMEPRHKS